MKVYMIEGYSLATGQQGIIDYIVASDESEACRKFERNNFECEANEILMEMDKEEFEKYLEECMKEDE